MTVGKPSAILQHTSDTNKTNSIRVAVVQAGPCRFDPLEADTAEYALGDE